MNQDHRLPEQVVRDISKGLADVLSQSWPKNADATFAGSPQININITAPPLPSRLIRLSKFAQCGLFAKVLNRAGPCWKAPTVKNCSRLSSVAECFTWT